eukprot:CAMPEP_0119427852 /NCGR_PEP_ID=MMETSP1335-20130426/39225_1 /TAXON_ID=259385 /ORGANISM="Chrysoculter rhomboideus, Strain RCC1486" /LENGTH=148 /DNA_ID=CAMNT_0007453513 /DNA_START=63 /DNA_END=511 /DNA_ORIENTATION=-
MGVDPPASAPSSAAPVLLSLGEPCTAAHAQVAGAGCRSAPRRNDTQTSLSAAARMSGGAEDKRNDCGRGGALLNRVHGPHEQQDRVGQPRDCGGEVCPPPTADGLEATGEPEDCREGVGDPLYAQAAKEGDERPVEALAVCRPQIPVY